MFCWRGAAQLVGPPLPPTPQGSRMFHVHIISRKAGVLPPCCQTLRGMVPCASSRNRSLGASSYIPLLCLPPARCSMKPVQATTASPSRSSTRWFASFSLSLSVCGRTGEQASKTPSRHTYDSREAQDLGNELELANPSCTTSGPGGVSCVEGGKKVDIIKLLQSTGADIDRIAYSLKIEHPRNGFCATLAFKRIRSKELASAHRARVSSAVKHKPTGKRKLRTTNSIRPAQHSMRDMAGAREQRLWSRLLPPG